MLLLEMPWATPRRPSIAYGILSAICAELEVSHETLYPNLDLAAQVGFEVAETFADERTLFGLSEHLFAADLFGREALSSDHYLDAVSEAGLPPPLDELDYLRALRDEVLPRFLDGLEARVLRLEPSVLGFSSPFNQVMSSLALAARLKKRRPTVHTIFGGACFDGEMGLELHRALPQVIDHVFLAEGEESFREYLTRRRAGASTVGIPGVTWFEGGQSRHIRGAPLRDLDRSPRPNYDAFFAERERVRRETGVLRPVDFLPFEGSRGCWWGEKSHCMFCGINGELMTFRAKTPARVVQDILELAGRYRVPKLTATDWIISRADRVEIFQRLCEADYDLELFFETRSDMSKSQVALMAAAGVKTIQPGIESFSTPLLTLMGKATSGIRQVQFLRWCSEHGVKPSYNLLAGFPGERVEWYLEQARLIPRLLHLPPPLSNLHFVEMHRFSPLFERRSEWGVTDYAVRADFRFNYPPGLVDTRKTGYMFEFSASGLVPREQYEPELRARIGQWIEAHSMPRRPAFEYRICPGHVRVTDTRHEGEVRSAALVGVERDVFLLCDRIQTEPSLRLALTDAGAARGDVTGALERLVALGLVMTEGEQFLALPTAQRARGWEALRTRVVEGRHHP